jgi:hypothetical protein
LTRTISFMAPLAVETGIQTSKYPSCPIALLDEL